MSELLDVLVEALTTALHETETSGGWWGHPECEEFARLVAPRLLASGAVQEAVRELVAREIEAEAEARRPKSRRQKILAAMAGPGSSAEWHFRGLHTAARVARGRPSR